jgi:serine/threonine protein kinase
MSANPNPAIARSLGDYDLLTRIGVGGLCEVYRSRHRSTGALVAVKILPEETARKEILLRRFEQEFRVASRLDHPNIVRALDFQQLPGQPPFLVMELVEGESLAEKVEREGRLAEEMALHLMAGACQGLHHAHERGVVHRDIKPDNLLLTAQGEIKITDFGLVKELLGDQGLTATGRGLGTPHYMAPEQFRNARTVDPRADIYALGATLYTLVTGTLPFGGESPLEAWIRKKEANLKSPRAIVPSLSPHVERAILRALEGDPQLRQSSCLELLRELRGPEAAPPAPIEKWYVRYESQEGEQYVVSQPREKLRRYLDEGLFRNAISVGISPSPTGPFLPPEQYEEFRRPTSPPGETNAPKGMGLWAWVALTLVTFWAALLAARLWR